MSKPSLRNTDGLTLLELLVAVVIFTVAMLLGSRLIVGYLHQVAVSEIRAQATEFAVEELERVRLQPYQEIASVPRAPVPESPDYNRSVDVATVGGGEKTAVYDYRVVTVTIEPPGGQEPVRVSTSVAP